MLARLLSATIAGIEAVPVQVEVDLARGLPAFDIVGLPDTAVRESRERVRAAVKNSGYQFPIQRITINLAPADLKKVGPHYDLAIATGILAAQSLINADLLDKYLVAGELSLTGEVRGVSGILPMALAAKDEQLQGVLVPRENAAEACLVSGLQVIPISKLQDVVNFFNQGCIGKTPVHQQIKKSAQQTAEKIYELDFAEIKGQEEAKRALEIAAAGSHNILMVGPPGSGKTMLARRLRTILPPLIDEEALEITKIYSVLGLFTGRDELMKKRPFRAPHHSISTAGLIGGGRIPEPGEVSLAHHGTLFLDELPEFHRDVLELLRQPLEEGKVTIIRAMMKATFPARIMLVAAMNPCPCGYYGDDKHQCTCSLSQINRYRSKISGPLLDRIDIHIEVPALNVDQITNESRGESSARIRERVMKAHQIQVKRYSGKKVVHNSQLKGKLLKKHCQLNTAGTMLIRQAVKQLGLSARAYDRILRLARTIADLEGNEKIDSSHLAEAIQYRSFDRKF